MGAQRCAGCGLQLAAYAVRVAKPRKQPRFTLWFYGLCVFFVVIGAGAVANNLSQNRRAGVVAALHDGSLASPAAFQQRCGNADSITEKKSVGQILEYRRAGIAVAFDQKSVIFAARDSHGRFDFDWKRVSDDYALGELLCSR